MKRSIEESYVALYRWLVKEHFSGYDPYDGINTDLGWLTKSKNVRLLMIYVNKFSPLNIRKLLKIKKSKNNKALALIIRSILKRPYRREQERFIEQKIQNLLSSSLIHKYGYHCWNANNIYIQTTREYQPPDMPGVIGTEICSRALLEYYIKHPERDDLKAVILSARNFFLKVLLANRKNIVFFRYKPMSPVYECIYNASIIAASFVARVNKDFRLEEKNNVIADCYNFLINRQNKDGSWNYGVDLRNGKEKIQMDFHQGYILDALLEYLEIFGHKNEIYEAYQKGLNFYYLKQFYSNGQSLYRYPRKYPIDIHNQAQGIITFSRAGRFNEKYLEFAKTIAYWTINNMQSSSGYFYYQKYPFLMNRIPYFRWGQAWMFYSLSHLLDSNQRKANI